MTVKFNSIEDSSNFIRTSFFCYEDLVPRDSMDPSKREVTKSF